MIRLPAHPKEALNKSFDKALLSVVEGLRTNGRHSIPFVVSLSNHTANPLVQRYPNRPATGQCLSKARPTRRKHP